MDDTKEVLPQPKRTIEIVYAGGTISSLATPEGYREGGHVVDLVSRLEHQLPGFTDRFDLGPAEVAYTGLSEYIGASDWESIKAKIEKALDSQPNAIVVTHGTDSMEQTARYLQKEVGERLATQNTKIILTGANEDLSHPSTDAWTNLEFAFDSANNEVSGVFVAFHGQIIPASEVIKEPFNDQTMNYASIHDSALVEATHRQQSLARQLIARLEQASNAQTAPNSTVEYAANIVRANHQELLDYIDHHDTRAVLLTLYHSGTANTGAGEMSVAELVRKLREEKGIVCFGVTENGEPVDLHSYETSVKLREAGVVPLYDMLQAVAAAKLTLLPPDMSPPQIIAAMLNNQIGEITEGEIDPNDIAQLKNLYS